MAIAECFGQVSASAHSRAIASSICRQLELEGKKKVADCGVATVDLGERSSDVIDLECGDVIEIEKWTSFSVHLKLTSALQIDRFTQQRSRKHMKISRERSHC